MAALLSTTQLRADQREDQQTLMRRYPFDPACPWGRIADGKGMLVRCIDERESRTLAKAGAATPAVRYDHDDPTSAPMPPPVARPIREDR